MKKRGTQLLRTRAPSARRAAQVRIADPPGEKTPEPSPQEALRAKAAQMRNANRGKATAGKAFLEARELDDKADKLERAAKRAAAKRALDDDDEEEPQSAAKRDAGRRGVDDARDARIRDLEAQLVGS